ncbi:MAG: DNA polymerase III subunit delta, partial [Lachnospiraceae bacterium]|nr:DNA polymerase III subunit delta [Lachnospiraceae bacterium]
MKRLNSDIKNKTFAPVYLLYGDEEYLREQYKNRLFQAASCGDTMNAMTVSGKETELEKLRDFTDTLPFFADRRVLLLQDTGLFKSASEGYDEWIQALPETACVIFAEKEIDKRNRLYKAVQNKGYAAELNHPDEKQLSSWVLQKIGRAGLSVTQSAFAHLMDICDP